MRYLVVLLAFAFPFQAYPGECGIGFRTAVISENQRDLGYCEVITEDVPVRFELSDTENGGEAILFGDRLPNPAGGVLQSDIICYDVAGWPSAPAQLECIRPDTPNIMTFTIRVGPSE